jgi:subtilisin family serine protease
MDDDSSSPVVFNGPNAATGSGNIYGHEIDPNAITVGAVPEQSPTTMENFSSIGPGEFLFDQNGNPLPTPIFDGKVNVVAPDGNNTTDPLINPFYGTSAAAPAAAAVGALVLQENPALLPADIANLLQDAATAIAGNPAVTGAGLVNANGAVGIASTLVFRRERIDRHAPGHASQR